jgi:hypothetical protein
MRETFRAIADAGLVGCFPYCDPPEISQFGGGPFPGPVDPLGALMTLADGISAVWDWHMGNVRTCPGCGIAGFELGPGAEDMDISLGAGAARSEGVSGQFSIIDWEGYPGGPRPQGPFRIIEGQEYEEARTAANAVNRALHQNDPSLAGMQLHEIHPVKLGGDPFSIANRIAITLDQHAAFTVWWNRLLRDLR